MIIQGRHYRTGRLCEIVRQDGHIRAIGEPGLLTSDAKASWIGPALFDLQINGGGGANFSSARLKDEDVFRVVELCRQHGIGGFCPTLITQCESTLKHGFRVLSQARREDRTMARAMPAFHLEGPYISSEEGPRGAHPLEHVRLPDWNEFQRLQESAEGLIRLVTLAPELPGCLRFIERLNAAGCIVAIGHTAAPPSVICDAVHAGARLSTHLGNGSHAFLPRHLNYLWEQLDQDNLWASIICDGCHLPASLVRTFLKVKTPLRTILTCDASSLAGLPPGDYREWEQDLRILEDGCIIVRDSGFLAGSWHFTDACVGKFLQMTGFDLATGIEMASSRPRELLGLPCAKLEVGAETDLMLFDWEPGGGIVVQRLLTP
ncbi:MAG TPA: N-acetylglucosamine-6-phosphate deacetylase [Gemmataceae bacterium]|jgi:N-acetylglucosamine-6-phosphate deacetylase|nr:N-acetylglucosamine-6-phosphate deacetylase [Gemmataceae bacterium]